MQAINFHSIAKTFTTPDFETITEFFTDAYLMPLDVAKKYANQVISEMGKDEEFLGSIIRPVYQGEKNPPLFAVVTNGQEGGKHTTREGAKHFVLYQTVSDEAKKDCRARHQKLQKNFPGNRFAVMVATEIEPCQVIKNGDEIHLGVQFWTFIHGKPYQPNGDGSTSYFIELL